MADKASLNIQTANFKAFSKWVSKNKSRLKPDEGKVKIFYADRMINMSVVGKKAKEIEKREGSDDLGPHIAKIESLVKIMTSSSIGGKEARYASIETMLRKSKSQMPTVLHPENGFKVKDWENMLEYAHKVAGRSAKVAYMKKGDAARVWSTLSEIYAKNTKGEIMILESGLNDVKRAFETSDLIRVELKHLRNNSDISKSSQKEVEKVIESYLRRLEIAAGINEKELLNAKKMLGEKL